MYDHMKSLIPWPTREQILANLPRNFSEMPQVRIVIDPTEFFCEKRSSLIAQNLKWSEYKHHNTLWPKMDWLPSYLACGVDTLQTDI